MGFRAGQLGFVLVVYAFSPPPIQPHSFHLLLVALIFFFSFYEPFFLSLWLTEYIQEKERQRSEKDFRELYKE
ncbi:hypothetical protein F5H01DRAFT_328804 [Linnemannia elongata]|nr:hypothetical protein F5H01DRAFT_328804 [Linnemannia elongata]